VGPVHLAHRWGRFSRSQSLFRGNRDEWLHAICTSYSLVPKGSSQQGNSRRTAGFVLPFSDRQVRIIRKMCRRKASPNTHFPGSDRIASSIPTIAPVCAYQHVIERNRVTFDVAQHEEPGIAIQLMQSGRLANIVALLSNLPKCEIVLS